MATHSVFLPGESHRQRSLVGNSPHGHKESDTAEATEHACSQREPPGALQSESTLGRQDSGKATGQR